MKSSAGAADDLEGFLALGAVVELGHEVVGEVGVDAVGVGFVGDEGIVVGRRVEEEGDDDGGHEDIDEQPDKELFAFRFFLSFQTVPRST